MRETEHRRADDGRPHDRNALRKSGEDEPAKEGLLGERRGDGDGHEVEQEVFGAVVLEQDERLELRGCGPKTSVCAFSTMPLARKSPAPAMTPNTIQPSAGNLPKPRLRALAPKTKRASTSVTTASTISELTEMYQRFFALSRSIMAVWLSAPLDTPTIKAAG